jgi:hypothetical protein
MPAVALEQHAPDRGVVLELPQELGDGRKPAYVHRVGLFGPIEGDGGNGARLFEQQRFGHLRLSSATRERRTNVPSVTDRQRCASASFSAG